MPTAVCWKCIDDAALSNLVKKEGERLLCVECGGNRRRALSIEQLAGFIAPIIEEHFHHGEERRVFGSADDDRGWYEQEGDDLSWVVQGVLGQYLSCEGELISAICDQEDCWPQDGDQPFFDTNINYVETKVSAHEYYAEWRSVLKDLKSSRRFFNDRAKKFFDHLFEGLHALNGHPERGRREPVVCVLPAGTELYPWP